MALFEPIQIGSMPVKNRIVMAPMTTLYAGPNGEVTDRLIKYYVARARGGVGLIIVESAYIDEQGCQIPASINITSDAYIPGLTLLVDGIKGGSADHPVACLQLIHAGTQAVLTQTVGPSAIGRKIAKPVKTPRALTTEEVEQIVEDFAGAALRAKLAGFDMVELHGTHGYLIQQFLSPLTNRRTDKYGADRGLFAEEIVTRAKAKCGKDYPMIWRLCSDEFEPGGITIEDAKNTAKRLEQAGIDAFDVTGGTYDTFNMYIEFLYDIGEEGVFRDLASEVKKVVAVPVISGASVDTPEAAERLISDEKVDMVFLGRALIADPYWPQKAQEGRVEDIRPCSKCTEGCGLRIESLRPVNCNVNPTVRLDYLWRGEDDIPEAKEKKKVLVIGGGPGGLECARVATIRGHDVTLVDKEGTLGGTLNVAAIPTFKKAIARLVEYYTAQLKKAEVKVMTNTTASMKLVNDIAPDVVVVATGSEPLVCEIPGIEKSVLADDVLWGKATVGTSVVVLGGGLVGCETALHLVQQGKKVTVIEAVPLPPAGAGIFIREARDYLIMVKLPMSGVEVITGSTVCEIRDGEVTITDKKDGMTVMRTIAADSIVNAFGRQAVVLEELTKIRDLGKETYVIGDARLLGKASDAILEGFIVALEI